MDTYCAAPWAVHTVNANGTVGVCCVNHHVVAGNRSDLMSGAAMAAMKSDMLSGRQARGCEKCYATEASGGVSLRHIYNQELERSGNGRTDADTLWFDLSMGNKCNQRCRICGPHNSTGWLRELRDLEDLEWAHVNTAPHASAHVDNDAMVGEILSLMSSSARRFTVELKGGEPLYIDSARRLLRAMVSDGLHWKTETLRIITNGTVIDDETMSLLRAFDSIDLGISVDAVGELHEYTRGTGVTWDECRRRWAMLCALPRVRKVRICNTIYAYNVFGMGRLAEWVQSEFGDEVSMANAVLFRPSYLSVRMLPRQLRLRAANGLNEDHPAYAVLHGDDDPDAETHRSRFREFTRRLDLLRGESLLDLVPQLATVMGEEE